MHKNSSFYLACFLILFFIPHSACKQQAKPFKVIQKKHSNCTYTDAIVESNIIWGLTGEGKINLFSADSGNYINKIVKNDSAILCIAKDKKGIITIGDNSNRIKQYQKTDNSFKTVLQCPNNLFGITFDNKNNYYLITDRGVFDAATNKTFYPDSSVSLSSEIHLKGGWFKKPVFVMDKKDNIWLGFGYGEWGGDLLAFSTVEKKFVNLRQYNPHIDVSPVKSIFEGNGLVYVSCGLMHFSTSGEIIQFEELKSKTIFESSEHKMHTLDNRRDTFIAGEYVGPSTYNAMDNCIYMYTQYGVFKGSIGKDLSKIEYWSPVFNPKLHWSDGQPDAVGSPMNILKLIFIEPNKLLFVSQNDGIGLYDDELLIMMR